MKLRIKGPDKEFSHLVETAVVTIGRSSENVFEIPLNDFSRKHCAVSFKGKYVFIMDLGSKNGVTIDGHQIKPHEYYPIYVHSKVILANYFELILPDGTGIRKPEDNKILLDLLGGKKF